MYVELLTPSLQVNCAEEMRSANTRNARSHASNVPPYMQAKIAEEALYVNMQDKGTSVRNISPN